MAATNDIILQNWKLNYGQQISSEEIEKSLDEWGKQPMIYNQRIPEDKL